MALRVGSAAFVRSEGSVRLRSFELLLEGLRIEGDGPLAKLDPPAFVDQCGSLPGAPADFSAPEIEAEESDTCVDLSRKAQKALADRGIRSGIVHGFAIANGVALPHAWVRVGMRDFDPAQDNSPVREGETHVAIACVEGADHLAAGELWMRVLSGKHRIVRR